MMLDDVVNPEELLESLQVPSILRPSLLFYQLYTVLSWDLWSNTRPAALLALQILHDPLRQRFGRGGVLSGIQLTVNHDVGLEKACLFEISSELHDLAL